MNVRDNLKRGNDMCFTHNQRPNPVPMGLFLCAATLLFAAGCSTMVNQGRHSPEPGDVKKMDPWVWGNAAFAVFPPVAVLGLGIDAFSGNWYRYTKPDHSTEENPFNEKYRQNDK